jgi:regulator of PEP synthase PpsR (kinase-PPPase family)
MGVEEHSYVLVRSSRQLDRVLENIAAWPGLVFFTLVNQELHRELTAFCTKASLPCLDVMAGPIGLMRQYLGQAESHRPGAQHDVDQRYLARIEALNFTIQHDDGQALDTINGAEVVLVGASRTSKTPTCVYLAIRGVRAANVPLVPGIPLPPQLLAVKDPWVSPDRLVQVRRNRLTTMGEARDTDYVDLDSVRGEVANTRRLFESQDWPAIDVSRRSVEETAASVINLLAERRGKKH